MKYRSLLLPRLLLLLLATGGVGCQTNNVHESYGIHPDHMGYVPARIAVLNCRLWPTGARFMSLPLSNVKEVVTAEICKKFDPEVLQAFSGQPYMSGFSPNYISKLLEKNNRLGMIDEIDQHWKHQEKDCQKCPNAASFYRHSLQNRDAWKLWLNQFSKEVRYADAVLIPFVMYAKDSKFQDRGLLVAERSARVMLFLIDTNEAALIWSNMREATIPNKAFLSLRDNIEPPEWEMLYKRLFTEDLWQGFPGRQVQ